MNWQAAARGSNVELKVFPSPEEFYADNFIAQDSNIIILILVRE